MRTLAIDYGERRIGLALSDAGGRLASPLVVLTGGPGEQVQRQISRVIEEEAVERLVVGLPLNMDGTTGPSARAAAEWARRLARQVNLPLFFVDERLSSFEAEQQLRDRKREGEKLTRKRRKEQMDALAAAQFLQAFLDGKLPPIDAP